MSGEISCLFPALDLLRRPCWPYQADARSHSQSGALSKALMKPDDGGTSAKAQRQARLAASLRENLKRRKAQARSRTAEAKTPADEAHQDSPERDAER